ncbi:MAG: hypothetical protein IPK72_01550 [Candidatus Eisenbacteria bacterium]|nr:hypothetical protein [Candidatus Eisenbacteria bacterium]
MFDQADGRALRDMRGPGDPRGVSRARLSPTAAQTVGAIARREIGLAAKRKLFRFLFLVSLLPPLVLIIILLVRLLVEQTFGTKLPWDPVLRFLLIQSAPVALLALNLGTPLVARDRTEDVLFLYAVRPVLPWHYALGKLLAVAVPATGLMLLPGVMIAGLRLSVTGDLSFEQALVLISKLAVASGLIGCAYAGVTVGASAAVKRARWALLLAVLVFAIPDIQNLPIGPASAVETLIKALFRDQYGLESAVSALALAAYGAAGFLLTTFRVRKEMIP